MNTLQNLIKGLYDEIPDSEAILAEGNLIGFFRKLEAIEQRLSKEELVSDLNQICDEEQHENFGS